jgi:sigma-54 specific flagellar transcriptional regulator A
MLTDLTTWRATFAPEIIGDSPEILDALDTVRHVAETDCSILITGETGSGKELFARAVHRASHRKGKPFIPVNCAAIPDSLLETELFGHVKGAFTGALTSRPGRFMSAKEGTIFLDEIGDLPLAAQAKLLRVLEERVVCPVGSDTDVAVDVRIVAATHRNLEEMVAQGKFRADLYFRLAVVPVQLPSLRDRREDTIRIAELCIERSSARVGKQIEGLDESGKAALLAYSWPGNVRELSHLIERAVLLSRRSRLGAQELQIPGTKSKFNRVATSPVGVPVVAEGTAPFQRPAVPSELAMGSSPSLPAFTAPVTPSPMVSDTMDLRTALENLERDLISKALTKAGGNRTEAAALLGLNRTTLVEKLRKYAA